MDAESAPTLQITDWKKFLARAKLYFEENYDKKGECELSLADFDIVRTLGLGAYGRVILARLKSKDVYYAIKMTEKKHIVESGMVGNSLNEKRMLQSTVFPFVVYMEHFFKDNVYLYFVMPYIMGGELFSRLCKVGKFPEHHATFYSAQIVLALEYLHSLGIIYRDLKPQNIVIDKWGYIKLTDMGLSKIVKGRTYTLCGTPCYIAPEIILSKGYGLAADWWSLGIVIYELCAGYPPFYSTDTIKMYEQIVACKFKMIPSFTSELKDLLSNMIQNDLTRRYGNLKNGVRDIKDHKWFKSITWLDIINRKSNAPFVPLDRGREDTSNFDPQDEEPFITSPRDLFVDEFAEF